MTRKQLSWVLKKAGSSLNRAGLKLYKSPQNRNIQWIRDQGDETLRLDYDLCENSLVFDLGGYKGQWASDIFAKYCCSIHIFEPVHAYAEQIRERFSQNKMIAVHEYGLGRTTEYVSLTINKDGSSIYKLGEKTEIIKLVKAINFLQEYDIHSIDLMKINIEGAEYDLLEYLLETDLIKKIQNVQVQFHEFMPNADIRMRIIQDKLAKTHKLTYQFDWIWENWHKN